MSLPTSPPRYATWAALHAPIKEGETGWRVYALQKGIDVTADGAFGPVTAEKLRGFQHAWRLVEDAVAGAKTQAAILRSSEAWVHMQLPTLREGLLTGFTMEEGAGVLAATNWYTPPGAPPGVDCGPVQWRRPGPPFLMQDLRDSFNARTAFMYAGGIFLRRINDYHYRRPALSTSMVTRCAVLAHNAPFLAEQMVRYGRLLTPTALAAWTKNPATGQPYTHEEWFEVYPTRILRWAS